MILVFPTLSILCVGVVGSKFCCFTASINSPTNLEPEFSDTNKDRFGTLKLNRKLVLKSALPSGLAYFAIVAKDYEG
jgi:hypothetical protein